MISTLPHDTNELEKAQIEHVEGNEKSVHVSTEEVLAVGERNEKVRLDCLDNA